MPKYGKFVFWFSPLALAAISSCVLRLYSTGPPFQWLGRKNSVDWVRIVLTFGVTSCLKFVDSSLRCSLWLLNIRPSAHTRVLLNLLGHGGLRVVLSKLYSFVISGDVERVTRVSLWVEMVNLRPVLRRGLHRIVTFHRPLSSKPIYLESAHPRHLLWWLLLLISRHITLSVKALPHGLSWHSARVFYGTLSVINVCIHPLVVEQLIRKFNLLVEIHLLRDLFDFNILVLLYKFMKLICSRVQRYLGPRWEHFFELKVAFNLDLLQLLEWVHVYLRWADPP